MLSQPSAELVSLSSQGSRLVASAAIYQATSFQRSAASFQLSSSLYQGISSHQIFLAVYKTLISLSLLGFILCKRSIFFFFPLPFVSVLCFSTGFQSIPGEKPGEPLEVFFFFFSPAFSFLRVKQKHEVRKEKKKKKVCKSYSWSASHQPAVMCHFIREPAEPPPPPPEEPDSSAGSSGRTEPGRQKDKRRQ